MDRSFSACLCFHSWLWRTVCIYSFVWFGSPVRLKEINFIIYSYGADNQVPKEKNSSTTNQFLQASLVNLEGKALIFPTEEQLRYYQCRRGFSGCLEHTNVIWHHVQTATKNKRDWQVVVLDLVNAFGSVPNELLSEAFNFSTSKDWSKLICRISSSAFTIQDSMTETGQLNHLLHHGWSSFFKVLGGRGMIEERAASSSDCGIYGQRDDYNWLR